MPCELAPAVPSLPPCQLHRDNRLHSHPPHFALTASMPTPPPPLSIKMRRLTPTPPPLVRCAGTASWVRRECCEEHVNSGNGHWVLPRVLIDVQRGSRDGRKNAPLVFSLRMELSDGNPLAIQQEVWALWKLLLSLRRQRADPSCDTTSH